MNRIEKLPTWKDEKKMFVLFCFVFLVKPYQGRVNHALTVTQSTHTLHTLRAYCTQKQLLQVNYDLQSSQSETTVCQIVIFFKNTLQFGKRECVEGWKQSIL